MTSTPQNNQGRLTPPGGRVGRAGGDGWEADAIPDRQTQAATPRAGQPIPNLGDGHLPDHDITLRGPTHGEAVGELGLKWQAKDSEAVLDMEDASRFVEAGTSGL